MTEAILVVIAVLAALAIAARKSTTGSQFPEPLEEPELPDPVSSEAETKP